MDPGLGAFIGFLATAGGLFALRAVWKRAPRLKPLAPRARVTPLQVGPVGDLAAVAKTRGVVAFRARVEQEVRDQLTAWLAMQDPAARRSLPPILENVLGRDGEGLWLRTEALAGYRGPSFLFPLWVGFARLTESRDARTMRYLDALSRAFQETMRS